MTFVGVIVENASQETVQVGTKKEPRMASKYSMEQLLDPEFRLPAPKTQKEKEREAVVGLLAWAKRGVKVIQQG